MLAGKPTLHPPQLVSPLLQQKLLLLLLLRLLLVVLHYLKYQQLSQRSMSPQLLLNPLSNPWPYYWRHHPLRPPLLLQGR
jgi:hypothetical protein